MSNTILTIHLLGNQINKILTAISPHVKLMFKNIYIVEKYYNICVAFFGHLLTKYFNVKFNT